MKCSWSIDFILLVCHAVAAAVVSVNDVIIIVIALHLFVLSLRHHIRILIGLLHTVCSFPFFVRVVICSVYVTWLNCTHSLLFEGTRGRWVWNCLFLWLVDIDERAMRSLPSIGMLMLMLVIIKRVIIVNTIYILRLISWRCLHSLAHNMYTLMGIIRLVSHS